VRCKGVTDLHDAVIGVDRAGPRWRRRARRLCTASVDNIVRKPSGNALSD